MRAARPLVYRRRASPLHAARATVAAAYGAALATAALIVGHPLLLAGLLCAVLGAAAGAGVGREIVRAAGPVALSIALVSVLVNVLVDRNGLTVFARLGDWGVLGQENLTLEAVVYGLVIALRMLVVALACVLVLCAADFDELLFAVRRVSPRSALTAALSTRLVPVLAADARRLAEAQRCRPDGGARGARGTLAVVRASVSGALERSLDLAAVLEMRGYGAHGRAAPEGRGARGAARGRETRAPRRPPKAHPIRRPPSRHDLAFAASALALLALALAPLLAGLPAFRAYPLVRAPLTPAWIALTLLAPLLALAPFADRRGIEP
jgi:energy-coupling factor transport system permease protein